MSSSAREAGLGIVPSIATIREAQRFLATYFAPTRLVAAPYLSAAAGTNVYLKTRDGAADRIVQGSRGVLRTGGRD